MISPKAENLVSVLSHFYTNILALSLGCITLVYPQGPYTFQSAVGKSVDLYSYPYGNAKIYGCKLILYPSETFGCLGWYL